MSDNIRIISKSLKQKAVCIRIFQRAVPRAERTAKSRIPLPPAECRSIQGVPYQLR